MDNLRLFIVAGPNGSGKSLFSSKLTESDYTVFDGDKHLTEFAKKYPETGSDILSNAVNEQVFKVEKLKAIAERKSYAFETNFSASNPMETANEFRNAGYEIHLIFMGLNSIEESIQRVEHRVRLGGHKVAEPSIRYNYEHGFKNLYKHFHEFDSVTLYDNAIADIAEPIIPREILYIVEGQLHLEIKDYPEWVGPLLERL